jgi:hypothetical protein
MSVQIVFHLKDLPLALIIQKVLGEGSIARKKGVNAYILTINSYKGLPRTPKPFVKALATSFLQLGIRNHSTISTLKEGSYNINP